MLFRIVCSCSSGWWIRMALAATFACNVFVQHAEAVQRDGAAADQPAPRLQNGLVQPRGQDGNGSVVVSGELKQWHKISLTPLCS